MDRITKILLTIYLVLAAIFSGLAIYVSRQGDSVNEPLSRSVEQQIFFGRDSTEVTIELAPQPELSCAGQKRPANIVLLLDKSGSLIENGIDYFSDVQNAAEAFVGAADLTEAEVALLYFNAQVEVASPLSADKDALINSMRFVDAGGDTNILLALEEAGRLLVDANQVGGTVTPVIVLLSDGGVLNQRAPVRLADQFQQQGIRIITIAMGETGNRQLNFLEDVASSPSDAYRSLPADLESVYTDIANQINNTIYEDVEVIETVNPRFTVEENLNSGGLVNENEVTWRIPSLNNAGYQVSYFVTPPGIGLFDLNAEETTLTTIQCGQEEVVLPLAASQDLLVLPPLFLLIFLALLPLFAMMFFRRNQNQDPLPQPATPSRPVAVPMPERFPAWMKALDIPRLEDAGDVAEQTEELSPTIMIGLGAVGRVVLNQVAQTLRMRFGSQLPANIRLAYIDIQPKGAGGPNIQKPEHLTDAEFILLQPDLNDIHRKIENDRSRFPHCDWYDTNDHSGRMRARLALFGDLANGTDNSKLWSSISQAVYQLQNPKIRLISGAFDETGSGLLIDVAHLTQTIIAGGRSGAALSDVELWLSGPLGESWSHPVENTLRIDESDQTANTLATLREIERFQRNEAVEFNYVRPNHPQVQLRSEAHSSIVQSVYLFERTAQATTIEDHLTTMAEGILAVQHIAVQQAFNQKTAQNIFQEGKLINEDGLGMVSSLGAYSVRTPLTDLTQAISCRALYELLAEKTIGLIPQLEAVNDGTYVETNVQKAIRDNAQKRNELANEIIEAYSPNLDQLGFYNSVAEATSNFLNGFDPKDPLGRQGSTGRTRKWISTLRSKIENGYDLEGVEDVQQSLRSLNKQIDKWHAFIKEEAIPAVQHEQQAAQQRLVELAAQQGRAWMIDADGDWPVYQQEIRPQMDEAGRLAAASAHYGWHTSYDRDRQKWTLSFLITPPGFQFYDEVYVDQYAIAQEKEPFVQRLKLLTDALARRRTAHVNVFQHAKKISPQTLYEQADPRLNVSMFGERIDISESTLLVAKDSEPADELKIALESTQSKPNVTLCATEDNTAVTVLRLRSRTPLSEVALYGQEVWQSNYVDTNRYIRNGEQAASRLESSSSRFSAQFVGWLERKPHLVRLFAEAILLGQLSSRPRDSYSDILLWQLPHLGGWAAKDVADALRNLVSETVDKRPERLQTTNLHQQQDLIDQLQRHFDSLKNEMKEAGTLRDHLRAFEKELASQKATDPITVGLNIYLKRLVEEYRKR